MTVLATDQEAPSTTDRDTKSRGVDLFRVLILIARVGLLGAFVGAWQLAIGLHWVSPFFVSTPSKTATFLWDQKQQLLTESGATLLATLIAFACSAVAGVVSGMLLTESKFLTGVFSPYITLLNSLPRIALAPLIALWFGIGVEAKVVLAFTLGYFVVLINTIAGLKNVDEELVKLGTSLGCGRIECFIRIKLPWSVPTIFAGFRLALVYAFLGVVMSEMLGSRHGLGQLILYYSGLFRTDGVLAIIFVMAVEAVLLTLVMERVERLLLRGWLPSK